MPTNFTFRKPTGFTLVELLVAIAILAILSLIGLTIYTNLMKQARDGKRISDIDAIANTLELHYDPTTAQYESPIDPTWFSGSAIPSDPIGAANDRCGAGGTNHCQYCLRNQGSGENECTHPAGIDHDIASSAALPDQIGFMICTNLENAVNGHFYYCKHSARYTYN